jgi:transposase
VEAGSERRRRRSFTAQYKAEVVELCRTSGSSIATVARELGLTETAVRRWVAQAEIDAGHRDGLTTAEREELSRLRKENRVLREERDVLKRATVFFAAETR